MPSMRSKRAFRAAACVVPFLSWATPGSGETPGAKDRRACATSYELGQELAHAAKLLRAKQAMQACAKPTCGAYLERECSASYNQLDLEIPTVVPQARDDKEDSLADVQVTVDGELLASSLDGRAFALDPGLHEFSFRSEAGATARQRLMVLQGQHNRVVSVLLKHTERPLVAATEPEPGAAPLAALPVEREVSAPPPAASPPDPPRGAMPAKAKARATPLGPYLMGGFGLAGIGAYAVLVHWAREDNNWLTRCSPGCPEASVDHIRNLYIAADVSLGVGITALVASTWMFVSVEPTPVEAARPSTYAFSVNPSHAGVVATVSGAF